MSIIHPELSWRQRRGAKPHRNGSLLSLLRLSPAYKSAKRGRGVKAGRLGRRGGVGCRIQSIQALEKGLPHYFGNSSSHGATFYVQLVSQPWLCGWPCRYIESPPHDKSGEDPKIGHAFSKPSTDLKANLPHTKEGSSNGGC